MFNFFYISPIQLPNPQLTEGANFRRRSKFLILTIKTLPIGKWKQLSDNLTIILTPVQPPEEHIKESTEITHICVMICLFSLARNNYLLHGNSTACASAWPSSLTITLFRNQPQPPPLPSCPILTLRICPRATASIMNSSNWP